MSLIDDALKRAQEASRKAGEKEKARPWTPAPLPDAGLARRRGFLRALRVTLLGLGGLILAVFLGRLVWNAAAPSDQNRPAAIPAPVSAPPTVPAAVNSVPTVAPTAAVAAVAPARPRPTRVAIPQTPDVLPEVVEVPPVPSTLADGRTFVGVVNLPEGRRIELGGIAWSEEAPRAVLNDRIVATDAYVEGFTVKKIEENRVTLERDGMTIYLSIR